MWPQTFAVGPIPHVRVGHSDEGLSNRDRAGYWGDPPGVRRYRRGDRFRHIHWTQTAQRGELMVCELQASAAPRVLIILDSRPEVHSGRGPSSSLEWGAVAPVRDAGNHHSLWVPKSRAGTGSRARRAFVRTNEAGSMRTSPHRFLPESRWLAWWHSASSAVSHTTRRRRRSSKSRSLPSRGQSHRVPAHEGESLSRPSRVPQTRGRGRRSGRDTRVHWSGEQGLWQDAPGIPSRARIGHAALTPLVLWLS
ncbi:MAG: DUF58 domain-containing protein [Isosphaeraceae bacterium]